MKSNNKRLTVNLAVVIFILYLAMLSGCKKFLDEKPQKSDVVPTTLNDLQSLLDNANSIINSNSAAAISELVADNYYITTSDWQSRANSTVKSAKSEAAHYIWDKDAIPYENAWNLPYERPIYYANIVLDQLPIIKTGQASQEQFNSLKGSALFYRAFNFWGLAQLFCKPFSDENRNEKGIVLRLTSNVSAKSERSTIQQTYDQIINDLKEAASLLPENTLFPTRPSKAAAYAALARAYLSMADYSSALENANQALQRVHSLIDFNTLTPGSPIVTFNPEVIFHSTAPAPVILTSTRAKIDSTLYQSYNTSDLRKGIFYKANTGANANTYSFRGCYNGTYSVSGIFDGLAVDELYLIRSECLARSGKLPEALADLNTLLEKRWNSTQWSSITAGTAEEALDIILQERRKELVFRGIRWSDIRRLNLEDANIELKRIINGTPYTLSPNDVRSVLLIPWEEITHAGIDQNPR